MLVKKNSVYYAVGILLNVNAHFALLNGWRAPPPPHPTSIVALWPLNPTLMWPSVRQPWGSRAVKLPPRLLEVQLVQSWCSPSSRLEVPSSMLALSFLSAAELESLAHLDLCRNMDGCCVSLHICIHPQLLVFNTDTFIFTEYEETNTIFHFFSRFYFQIFFKKGRKRGISVWGGHI